MTAAAVLAMLIKFAEVAAPAIAGEVAKLVAAFKAGHPELDGPPPPDGEAKVDALIDARVAAMAPPPDKPGSP